MVSLFAAGLLVGCGSNTPIDLSVIPGLSRPADEVQIARVLDDVHRAMEQKQVKRVLRHVAPAYADDEGRTYQQIEAELSELFRIYRSIRIQRAEPRITVEGDSARALETFGTSADPANLSEHPPINIQGPVVVYLERIDGVWLITRWSNS